MIEPVTARDMLTRLALDPHHSMVVEACAGSGKTWLLVSRMLRQLLAGATPASLLAITFTRKAAQEMKTRLMSLLEQLAVAPEEEVRALLHARALNESEIDAVLPKARSLFTEVTFASPGLAISTFHGWFQQLLAAAPLGEGNGDSNVTDSEHRLAEEAWLTFAEALNRESATPAAAALHNLFAGQGLFNTRKLLGDFIARRAEWRIYARETLGVAAEAADEETIGMALRQWQSEWRVDPDHDPTQAWMENAAFWIDARTLASGLSTQPKLPKTVRQRIEVLQAGLPLIDADSRYTALCGALLTEKGSPVKIVAAWAEKSALQETHARLCAALDRLRAARLEWANYALNRDALIAGLALLAAYEKLKRDQRQLDYADLEWRAFELLSDSVHAETLQYRLDCRYRHILLDEFQDTNPIQWRCLTAWLDASVAAGNPPTVFMVGDPKQAIYRFRRTDARLFERARDYFVAHFNARYGRLDHTRRNAPAVTHFVNRLFDQLPGFAPHISEQSDLPGGVALLPPFANCTNSAEQDPEENKTATESANATIWRNPLTRPLADDTEDRFAAEAQALAAAIRAAVGQISIAQADAQRPGQVQYRPACYGDFLVLFRRRLPLETFEQALKTAHIPYISARPGGLMETLEVRDLSALLTFLATPIDDLALAQVLKSPLFAASDEDLLTLRFAVEHGAWWQRLQALHFATDDTAPLARAQQHLRVWSQWMDTLPVHDLLDRIYHDGEVITRYAAAVPATMRDAVIANLHAFMALALQVDSGRYPSLPRFLDELKNYRKLPDQDAPDAGLVYNDDGDGDGSEAPDAVRMMTIHAAKGLEAPIVWLIDAADAGSRSDHHHLVIDWPPDETAPRHISFVANQATRGETRRAIFDEEERYAARERLNLLYVAATRARQYFVMSGSAPAKTSGQEEVSENENSKTSWLEWACHRVKDVPASWPPHHKTNDTANDMVNCKIPDKQVAVHSMQETGTLASNETSTQIETGDVRWNLPVGIRSAA